MSREVEVQSEEDFSRYLISYGIPIGLWGKGTAKTICHLMREVKAGETVLTTKGGELLRQVGFSTVYVIYKDGKNVYELKEDHQEFGDGRIRRRDTGSSLSEKIQRGENPKDAAERALREELGVLGRVQLTGGRETEEFKESLSYPGLQTQYLRYAFEARLIGDQYLPEGYVEHGEHETTYFIWHKR